MTKMPTEEALWNNAITAFASYEKTRALFRPATKKVIKHVLGPYLKKGVTAREIGSGLGELAYNLLPSSQRAYLMQTEQGKKLIAEHKRLHPESNVMQANVYNLPFSSESCDVVVGFASFDTFLEIKTAIKEMKRVLKEKGTLIHFLDLRACPEVVLRPYINNKDYTLLPTLTKKKTVGTFIKIKRSFLTRYLATHRLAHSTWYQRFLTNPEKAYDFLNKKKLLAGFAKEVADIFGSKLGWKIIDENKYFFERIKKSLKKHGFAIESFGLKEASAIIKNPSHIQQRYPQVNCIIHDFSATEFWNSPALNIPSHKLAIISCVHVLVAKKISS